MSNVQPAPLECAGLRRFQTICCFDIPGGSSTPRRFARIRLRSRDTRLLQSAGLRRLQLPCSLHATGFARLLGSSADHRLSDAQARLRKARRLIGAQLIGGANACRFTNSRACCAQIRSGCAERGPR